MIYAFTKNILISKAFSSSSHCDINHMKIFNPDDSAKSNAHIDSIEEYKKKYKHSIDNPEEFWAEQAERISWFKKWDKTWEWNFNKAEVKWFEGAKLNASYNCIDRHVNGGYGDKPALIWEGNDPSETKTYTYEDLLEEVQLAANALKNLGVKKGDRVCIYMQMIPELAISVLACARIGAVHSVVFGAFAPDSLEARINDSKCKVLITQDTGVRGTKNDIPMKQNGDIATKKTPSIEKVLVVKRTGSPIEMDKEKDVWWHDAINSADKICVPEEMDAEDLLFILYTSGSTGKPKGVMHTTGGYMVYTSTTHHYIFDYHPDEVYWCTADIGWITGHSYIIYGPMANRATTMMFEGVPNYPDYGRFWEIIEKHKVNKFYTAPTALRALMKEGDKWPNKYNLGSLKILGTVGEPIKEPEWLWYHKIIGKEKCPIVDTWWQTETGGIMIAPLPAVTPTKPGSATLPFFGIVPELLDDEGNVLEGNNVEGNLVMQRPWPGMMRTVYGDHQRFFETYFEKFPGKYFSGDGCKRDEDGYYWITGRVDDVIIVSGHNLGTAEIEGSIGGHPDVAEAAVVGYPHEIKGNAIYAFVTLRTGHEVTENTKSDIIKRVRADIGPHASPGKIQFTEGLPKTRSGKIMRRILRSIASGNIDNMGDISTLADPSVVSSLVDERI